MEKHFDGYPIGKPTNKSGYKWDQYNPKIHRRYLYKVMKIQGLGKNDFEEV
jgi:hypothetical protein